MRFIFPLLAFVALPVLGDCSCCGCADGTSCDINSIVDAITNAAQNACSSNCVKLTPATCMQLKNDMGTYLDSVTNTAESALYYAEVISQNADSLKASLDLIQGNLSTIKEDLENIIISVDGTNQINSSSVSSALTVFHNLQSYLISMSNSYSNVELPESSGSYLIYSNKVTGAFLNFNFRGSVVERVRNISNRLRGIENVLSRIGSYDSSELLSVRDNLISTIENLSSVNGEMSGEVYMIQQSAGVYKYELQTLATDGVALASVLDTFDCSPCGSGSGSGSSDGSSPSVQIDFTPVVYELQYLRQRLDYHLNRLYDLVKRFYQDYDHAADNIPDYDLSTYPTSKNWFVRVEQLLAVISDPVKKGNDTVGDNVPTDPPPSIDESEPVKDLETNSTSAETDAQTQASDLGNVFSSGWDKVSRSLNNLADSLRIIGKSETNIDRMPLQLDFGMPGSSGKYTNVFVIPDGTTNRLSVIRRSFQIVWALLCAFLYIYAFKLFFSLLLAYIAWFLKLASATFGS